MDNNSIPLPALAAVLRAKYGDAPSYLTLYRAVLDGAIPAAHVRGRWHVNPETLAKIAERFGLTAQAA